MPGRWRVLNPGEAVLHLKPFCRQGGRHGHSVGGEFLLWGAALSGFYGLGKGQHKDQNIGHKTT